MAGTYLLVTAFLVGLSGAMAPGPLTAVTIEHSLKKGFLAGPLVALGHIILEIMIIIMLVAGLSSFLARDSVGGLIGLLGGLVLFWMGYKMFTGIFSGSLSLEQEKPDDVSGNSGNYSSGFFRSSIAAGTITTFANPYWFIWWATVGAGYITISLRQGTLGVLLFSLGHIAADLGWLSFISFILATGKQYISENIYRAVMVVLAVFIIGMGVYFIWSGFNMFGLLG